MGQLAVLGVILVNQIIYYYKLLTAPKLGRNYTHTITHDINALELVNDSVYTTDSTLHVGVGFTTLTNYMLEDLVF